MKLAIDLSDMSAIREFFEDCMYATVDFRVSLEAPIEPTGFASYEALKKVVDRLDPALRTLFRLFRLGEVVDNAAVDAALPSAALDRLRRAGLLEKRRNDDWSTPGLLLVPIESLLVFVGVPPSYPTATAPNVGWFDLSSYVFAKSIPGNLKSKRVLEICSGSGVQSVLCAKNGAEHVVGLEVDTNAVALARCNAALNGFSARMEFRQSDKLAALREGEQFDFVLCNGPYAPVSDGPNSVSSLDCIGNRVLVELVKDLPGRVASNGRCLLALWRSIGNRSQNEQRSQITRSLAQAGLRPDAFVDLAQDGIEGMLRILQADVSERYGPQAGAAAARKARALLAHAEPKIDGCYNQLLLFAAGRDARNFGLDSAIDSRRGR